MIPVQNQLFCSPVKLPEMKTPKANENIRVKTDSPPLQKTAASQGVGSEITDGEDA